MTKISFIMITARDDFPYSNRPDLHVFKPTLECFKQQTMTDFEWIIVDVLYEQRKDYFKDMKLPFKVKHVPAKPNYWLERGFPAMSSQFNKGIIHADSECLFFAADGYMMQPTFMESVWKRYKQGFFPFAWYFYDLTFDVEAQTRQGLKPQICPLPPEVTPYNFDGFTGKSVAVDFRYHETWGKKKGQGAWTAGWNWFYGQQAVSLESMLKINGWDELFDGDRSVMDCDAGSRLEMAGYDIRFAMFPDLYLIRAVVKRVWNESISVSKSIKCNYGLLEFNRHFKVIRANERPLTDQDIQWIKEKYCPTECTTSQYCRENHKWQYPFEHKDGFSDIDGHAHNSKKEYWNMWREYQNIFDLAKEREKRIKGEKIYATGTFIN